MSHVTTKKILTDARKRKYGIPCFLAGNMEMIVGQIQAAEKCGSPLIMAYNQWLTTKIPMDLIVPFMVRAAEKASVPVATILDHGTDIETVEKVMALGISSVMFDGSSQEYNENVRMTKEVVKIAKKLDVAVEAELGNVGGSALEKGGSTASECNYTDPALVVDFVKKTEVDQLAISFGNLHGAYMGEPKINFKLIEEVFRKTELPLVMHGGSGLSEADYRKVIECGISKINYYSVMGKNASSSLKNTVENACPNSVYHEIIDWSVDFFDDFSAHIYDVFGCAGKAYAIPGRENDRGDDLIERITKAVFESYTLVQGRLNTR